jgi:hypothetical protein
MDTILYPVTLSGFVAVTFIFYGWAFRTMQKGMDTAGFSSKRKRKTLRLPLLLLLVWILFISIFSIRGFFSDFSSVPPRMATIFIIPLITIIILTFSKTLKEILPHIPIQNIIRIQVFRVFVEMLLWMLLLQHLLPVEMTLEGRNFDILTGLTAPVVAWLIGRKKWSPALLIIWNIAGLVLVFNVMIIAILSMPTPFRVFMNEPSNTIVTTFPFIWLPGLLVPLAYGLHFFSIRQILLLKRS